MLKLSGQDIAAMLGLEWSALGPLSMAMYSEIAGKVNASILAPLQGLMLDQKTILHECYKDIQQLSLLFTPLEDLSEYGNGPSVLREIEAMQKRLQALGAEKPTPEARNTTLALREQVAALRQVLTIHRNKLAADPMALFLDEKAKSLLKETDKVLEGTKQ